MAAFPKRGGVIDRRFCFVAMEEYQMEEHVCPIDLAVGSSYCQGRDPYFVFDFDISVWLIPNARILLDDWPLAKNQE